MMDLLYKEAADRGYVPDSRVCAAEVPAGRPEPWMCLKNAMNLGIYPMEAYVKVGDTIPDINEGLNAGMWTIGLAVTGNEMGLLEKEIAALDPDVRERKRARVYTAGTGRRSLRRRRHLGRTSAARRDQRAPSQRRETVGACLSGPLLPAIDFSAV